MPKRCIYVRTCSLQAKSIILMVLKPHNEQSCTGPVYMVYLSSAGDKSDAKLPSNWVQDSSISEALTVTLHTATLHTVAHFSSFSLKPVRYVLPCVAHDRLQEDITFRERERRMQLITTSGAQSPSLLVDSTYTTTATH